MAPQEWCASRAGPTAYPTLVGFPAEMRSRSEQFWIGGQQPTTILDFTSSSLFDYVLRPSIRRRDSNTRPMRQSMQRRTSTTDARPDGSVARAAARTLAAGVDHHRRGLLDEAAAFYRRVLKEYPKHPDALHLLGRIDEAKGDPAQALALIDRAIAARQKNRRLSRQPRLGAAVARPGGGRREFRCGMRFRSIRTAPRRPMFSATRCSLRVTRQRRSSAIARALTLRPRYRGGAQQPGQRPSLHRAPGGGGGRAGERGPAAAELCLGAGQSRTRATGARSIWRGPGHVRPGHRRRSRARDGARQSGDAAAASRPPPRGLRRV